MLMTMEQHQARQQRNYEIGREMSKAPAGMQILGPQGMALSTMRSEATTTEQYRYSKRGWPYAAILPIANRVSKELMLVARPSSDRNRRDLDVLSKSRLPTWVKSQQWASLEPLANHPLLEVLANPNPFMTQQMLMWVSTFSLKATGKCFWWFNQRRDGLTLWYVPAHWVEPDKSAGLQERWLIKPEGHNGEPWTVPGDEILPFWWPDPSNQMESLAAMSAGSRTVLTDDAIEESQHSGMTANQMPTNAFIIGEKIDADGIKRRPELTEDQRREIDNALKRLFSGPSKHGRAILLDGLITDVKRLSMAPTEMDYLASSKLVERKLEKLIGTNPIMMGEVESANRASGVIAEDIFLANQINPVLVLFGQGTTKYIQRTQLFGKDRVVAYYQDLVARDPELEQKDWHKATDMGFIVCDDFRVHRLGLQPLPGGKGQFARVNMALATIRIDEDTDKLTQDDPQSEEQQRQWKVRLANLWEKQRRRNEAQLLGALEGFFQRQAVVMGDAVRDGARTGQAILPVQEWTEKLKETIGPYLRSAMFAGAGIEDAVFKSFKAAPFDPFGIDNKVAHWIDGYFNELLAQPYWDAINANIADELDVLLNEYAAQGMDSRAMADALTEKFDDLSHGRAMRISNTELQGSMNAGAYAMRQALADGGLLTGQEWNSILDRMTRGQEPSDQFDHVQMDGQRVGIRENFNVDGESAPFPGHYSLSAANRIGCRCRADATTILD